MPTVKWNKRWSKGLRGALQSRGKAKYFGDQWGTPSRETKFFQRLNPLMITPEKLAHVVESYIEPYVKSTSVVMEIGSGGGRWTRYFLKAKETIIVELNPESFEYLKSRFGESSSKFRFYNTSGYELDGILDESVDFMFSFGTFVHIDPEGIGSYMENIKRILKQGGTGVIHYSNKERIRAKLNPSFSRMNPTKMELLVSQAGLKVVEHNDSLLNHSSIVVFQK